VASDGLASVPESNESAGRSGNKGAPRNCGQEQGAPVTEARFGPEPGIEMVQPIGSGPKLPEYGLWNPSDQSSEFHLAQRREPRLG
jgi:hypothetical protein